MARKRAGCYQSRQQADPLVILCPHHASPTPSQGYNMGQQGISLRNTNLALHICILQWKESNAQNNLWEWRTCWCPFSHYCQQHWHQQYLPGTQHRSVCSSITCFAHLESPLQQYILSTIPTYLKWECKETKGVPYCLIGHCEEELCCV